MTGRRLFVVLLALALLNLHCQNDDGFARFDAQFVADDDLCEGERLPFEPDFLRAKTRTDRVGLFLETARDSKHRSNGAYFEIYHPSEVTVGQSLTLGGPQVPAPEARAKLAFFSSCPDSTLSLTVDGQLTFDHFDPEPGGRIAGRLIDASAFDTRDQTPIFDDLQGEFDFTVRSGQPYQDFFAAP